MQMSAIAGMLAKLFWNANRGFTGRPTFVKSAPCCARRLILSRHSAFAFAIPSSLNTPLSSSRPATLLFFVVVVWEDDFTGYVVDYGTFPDQKRPYFTLRDARSTRALVTQAGGLEGTIYAGLERLTNEYLGREWRRDDGAMLRIERCLVDAN